MRNIKLGSERARRRGRRFDRRFARHLLCALLIVNMLLNSIAVTAVSEYVPMDLGDVLETGNDAMQLGDSGANDAETRNLYEYHLQDEKEILLSTIIDALKLPFTVKKVEMAAVLGLETLVMPQNVYEIPAQWLSVEPTKVMVHDKEKDDYLITVLADFVEAAFAVYTADDVYTIKLTHMVAAGVDGDAASQETEGESALEEHIEGDDLGALTGDVTDVTETDQSLFTYDLGGASEALLSQVLAALQMPLGMSEIEAAASLGSDDGGDEALSVLPEEGDYRVTALRDFDSAALALYTADGMTVVTLLNGRKAEEPVEPSAAPVETPFELTEGEPAEAPIEAIGDEPVESPIEQQLENEPVEAPAEPVESEPVEAPVEILEGEPVEANAEPVEGEAVGTPIESIEDEPVEAVQKPSPDGEGGAAQSAVTNEVPQDDETVSAEPIETEPAEGSTEPVDAPEGGAVSETTELEQELVEPAESEPGDVSAEPIESVEGELVESPIEQIEGEPLETPVESIEGEPVDAAQVLSPDGGPSDGESVQWTDSSEDGSADPRDGGTAQSDVTDEVPEDTSIETDETNDEETSSVSADAEPASPEGKPFGDEAEPTETPLEQTEVEPVESPSESIEGEPTEVPLEQIEGEPTESPIEAVEGEPLESPIESVEGEPVEATQELSPDGGPSDGESVQWTDSSEDGSADPRDGGSAEALTDEVPENDETTAVETIEVEPAETPIEQTVGEPTEVSVEPVDASQELGTTEFPTDELLSPEASNVEENTDEFPAPISYPAQDFTGRVMGVAVNVSAPEGAFPEGTTMKVRAVRDADTLSDAADTAVAEDDFVEVKRLYAVDITFYDAQGIEIEPLLPIGVVMSVAELAEDQEATVVHVDDEGNAEIVEQSDATAVTDDGKLFLNVEMPAAEVIPTEVAFTSDAFSTYVIVVTATITTRYIDAAGNTYGIEVGYGPEAEIPAGAELRVEELTGADAEDYTFRAADALGIEDDVVTYAKALDISIVKDGVSVQPQAPVQVSVRLLDAPEAKDYDNVNVLHFGEEVEQVNCALNGDSVEFEADGFSVYVIIESVNRLRFVFKYYDSDINNYIECPVYLDDDSLVYSQSIKSGEKPVVPSLSSLGDREFAGWYTEDSLVMTDMPYIPEEEAAPYDFDAIEVTENDEVTLYAVYSEYLQATFYGQYDSGSDAFPVVYTRRAGLQTDENNERYARIKISDLSAAYNSDAESGAMMFYGWSYSPVKTPGANTDDDGATIHPIIPDADGYVTIEGDSEFYPLFKPIHWVNFYASQAGSGASYNAPQYCFTDGSLSDLPITEMEGYTFKGWWTGSLTTSVEGNNTIEMVNYDDQITDGEGKLLEKEIYSGNVIVLDDGSGHYQLTLKGDATLYARWEKNTTASYRILIWKQKTTDEAGIPEAEKTYEYAQSITREGTVGEALTIAEDDECLTMTYLGYVYARRDEEPKTVSEDGSTALNVYYDLSDYDISETNHTLYFADSVKTEDTDSYLVLHSVENVDYLAPLDALIPDDPACPRTGYEFTQWYMDADCTIPAELSAMTMPDHDLTVYAGWEESWFIVTIDTNRGALYAYDDNHVLQGSGATWFWHSTDDEPIGEYTHVTRDYVESSSGDWYFVEHTQAWGGGDRYTYYTQDPGEATDDTTYEYAPGAYTYAGWYEVKEDGTEEPFDFSQKVDHAVTLRLHWKKNGDYYICYRAGDGTLADDQGSKERMTGDIYSDYAEVELRQGAVAPDGYTFSGWRVSGDEDGPVYAPGQIFTLHAEDAVRIGGKEIVYLDAVYEQARTARIIYDANGGRVSAEEVDYGKYPSATGDEPTSAEGTTDVSAGTATVTDIANNADFYLGDGTGFSYFSPTGEAYRFVGWSDKQVCDESAHFYAPSDENGALITYGVDVEEPVRLYAVWQTEVAYHLNSETAYWSDSGTWAWDPPYESKTLDSGEQVYTLTVNLGTEVQEPEYIPQYTGEGSRMFRFWADTDDIPADDPTSVAYDFSTPVDGPLDLYVYWGSPVEIPVHAVDASAEQLADKDGDWLKFYDAETGKSTTTLPVATEVIDLTNREVADSCAIGVPAGYAFAFAAAHKTDAPVTSITEDEKIESVYYNSAEKHIYAVFADGRDAALIEGEDEIYFVYYQEKAIPICYVSLDSATTPTPVTDMSESAPSSADTLGEYNVPKRIAEPLTWANNAYPYYAFAIGSASMQDASSLGLITEASNSEAEGSRPALKIRNTWRGFESSTNGGESWQSCGYAPTLYVLYFTGNPTVVTFHVTTVGTESAVESAGFSFNYTITEITKVGESEPTEETTYSTVDNETTIGPLYDGESYSCILFHTVADDTTTTQKLTVTQTRDNAFTTTVGDVETTTYEYTADENGGSVDVTFTNTQKSLPVEVHVAMVEDAGVLLEDALRNTSASDYSFAIRPGESVTLLERLPFAYVYPGMDASTYAFGTVLYGADSGQDSVVSAQGMDVSAVAFELKEEGGNIYELVLKDAAGNKLAELGEGKLYYLYYPMPRLQYVKKDSAGTLTKIQGSLDGAQSDITITYNREPLTMNQAVVAQDQRIEISTSGLLFSQNGGASAFRMPPMLDDTIYQRYLGYAMIGVGAADAENIDDIDADEGRVMRLRIRGNALQYSFDGENWEALTPSEAPTVYAVYTERGYDLQISKTVNMDASGSDPIFSGAQFQIVITSPAIVRSSYEVEGMDAGGIAITPSEGDEPGTIAFVASDGTDVKIKGLGLGEYSITETGNDNYILTAKAGAINADAIVDTEVHDNTEIQLLLNEETKVALTNNPKPICKITDGGTDRIFYTLRSAVDYASRMPSLTATIQMLTDYVMPVGDTVEIDSGLNITLTTAEEYDGNNVVAVILRTDALADVPMFTNRGALLAFESIQLNGNNIPATAPMIQSEADLTLGIRATFVNAKSSGNGSVVNATAGNITLSGATLKDNEAAKGGAIYYSGRDTITIKNDDDTGEETAIENNTATVDGGAIYAESGIIIIAGDAELTKNRAPDGNGGAIYAASALIEVKEGTVLTENVAISGGAIYAANSTITISAVTDDDGVVHTPSLTGNKATATSENGGGGAIWIDAGSVTISGGSLSNNQAGNYESGRFGGAIYANTASISISEKATLASNKAHTGGAIYSAKGTVSIAGSTIEGNEALTGGAVFANAGTVTLSGAVIIKNNTGKGDLSEGGAVKAATLNVTLDTEAEISGNKAGSGGAFYASSGTIVLSSTKQTTVDDEGHETEVELKPSITGNTATKLGGGAIWLESGSITISGGEISGNKAENDAETGGGNGGAIRVGSASVTVSSRDGFDAPVISNNEAKYGSGGAIYADTGAVTFTAGSVTGNTAVNGGAVYAGSGAVDVSGSASFTDNAASYNGGALYIFSGTATMTDFTMSRNEAQNGAAVYTDSGRVYLDGCTVTGNQVTANGGTYVGGAVGVGGISARLYLSGNVNISGNTQKTDASAQTGDDPAPTLVKSNIYLDQDSDAVINVTGLGTGASVGIFVADAQTENRDVPGARFASFTSDVNIAKITNDRRSFTVEKDDATKKLYWGKSIRVEVRYLASYSNGFPPVSSENVLLGNQKLDKTYNPQFNSATMSELAAEVFTQFSPSLTSTAVFGGAFVWNEHMEYGNYATHLNWNSTAEKWEYTKRDGTVADLDGHRIYLFYAEPAYISIENNTGMELDISELYLKKSATETEKYSVINFTDASAASGYAEVGYGMVYAVNGSTRTALLPVTANDLVLSSSDSINLMIPGGQGWYYTLEGSFDTEDGEATRLRRTGHSEETLSANDVKNGFARSDSTLNSSSTYQIIFGNDKLICKIVTAEISGVQAAEIGGQVPGSNSGEVEYLFTSLKQAVAFVQKYMSATKTATIEMLTNYLQPTTDQLVVPMGYDITITTASTGAKRYAPENSDEPRVTISRDSENTNALITAISGSSATALTIEDLIFNVKGVQGSTKDGAVSVTDCSVTVRNTDFKNLYADNGGAIKAEVTNLSYANSFVLVEDSYFYDCRSMKGGSRDGGGAIHAYVKDLTVKDSTFDACRAVWQAGAVFHRIENNNADTISTIEGCTFTNCESKAAGAMELGAKKIYVTGSTFEHCTATDRNGGAFNAYVNGGAPSADCWTIIKDCSFDDCHMNGSNPGNGGGIRMTSTYVSVINTSFNNTSAKYGGAIALTNSNAKLLEIYGCRINDATASATGGGVYYMGKDLVISDTCKVDADGNLIVSNTCTIDDEGTVTYTGSAVEAAGTRYIGEMKVENCHAATTGGVYHDKNAGGSKLTINNATIQNNVSSNASGGGVYTRARTVGITGSTISGNQAKGSGGGVHVYVYDATTMTIDDSTISNNKATNGSGGGVWFEANNNDTHRANMTLTIRGCTMDNNTASAAGGGVYTLAKTVTIQASETEKDDNGKPIPTTISNCTAATNGGGIYQNRNADGSSLTISDAVIYRNTSNNTSNNTGNGGGGIYTNVRALTITNATISNNTAKLHGGGILYECYNSDTARNAMTLTMEGCTLDHNTSDGNGGGIFTLAKTVEIRSHTEGEGDAAVTTPTTISNCTAKWSGGGIYHNRAVATANDVPGSKLTVTGATISGCVSNDTSTDNNPPRGGGGIFANVETTTVTDSTISGNKAVRNGGGIDTPWDGTAYALILDNTTVTGNVSDFRGGGIYTRTQLTLKNGTQITGNKLTTSTETNAAGVYVPDNRTLTVGEAGAEVDSTSVKGNQTGSGAPSNLRLWEKSGENASASVYVNCPLNGEIYVVNAKKVGTWFGSSLVANPNSGFSDDERAAFKADSSTLHGIIDRTDTEGKRIIWAGPPIAKITGRDDDGNDILLYRENGVAAIFDRLSSGNNANHNTVSAFGILNTAIPPLYTKGEDGTLTLYEGNVYSVKMLDSFTTEAYLAINYYEGRSMVFTTAGKDDEDGYPFRGNGTRATVTRGTGAGNNSLLNANSNLTLANIIIDGGSGTGIAANSNTRNLYVNNASVSVTLGASAILQNAAISGSGGGVYVNSGAFAIEGGIIRNCTATGSGGAVYKKGAGQLSFVAGNIQSCTASSNGGGVYIENGAFAMSGGTISSCQANNGGGLFVHNTGNAPLHMSGGSITKNAAATAGGGIAIGGGNSRLYFSKRPTVSGNTFGTIAEPGAVCNVQLSVNSKDVIRTNNGGLFGSAYIGVYVPGDDETDPYKTRGGEEDAFGTFTEGDSTSTLYGFVNDRNGLKGGLKQNPAPKTIYWAKIYSLEVSKAVKVSENLPSGVISESNGETFTYRVVVSGESNVTGLPDAKDIVGEYGGMVFQKYQEDKAIATFTLTSGESVTAENLSPGLHYEVTEVLSAAQAKHYEALPQNPLEGYIGENRDSTTLEEKQKFISLAAFTNLRPVCLITDSNGNLLYHTYTDDRRGAFKVPAAYLDLKDAFDALTEGTKETLYIGSGENSGEYDGTGYQIQMLATEYILPEQLTAPTGVEVTLTTAPTTAPTGDTSLAYQGSGNATIKRGFNSESMLLAAGDLTVTGITLDGAKGSYTGENGGIVSVPYGGSLTITQNALLQNSTVSGMGGAVYVARGGEVTFNAGTVNGNAVSASGKGAGIYLAEGGKLFLSGNPGFGGSCVNRWGDITATTGNIGATLRNQKNGSKTYSKAHQDIYIAGYAQATEDDDVNAESVVLTGSLNCAAGSIWVWAETSNHYGMFDQFAVVAAGVEASDASYKAFRNAQPDGTTSNDDDTYLSGAKGEASYVYWGGGVNVQFNKVDADGNPLANAVFRLYTDKDCQTVYRKGGTAVYAKSADGSDDYTDASGKALDVGVVLFRRLPVGIYYMKETEMPEVTSGNGVYAPNDSVYRLTTTAAGFTLEIENEDTEDTWNSVPRSENEYYIVNKLAICKIVTGRIEHLFSSLRDAVRYARKNLSGTATIQMLVDYTMPSDDALTGSFAIGSSEEITLTTATTGVYRYSGSGNAIITRGYDGLSMIASAGQLTLDKIVLDGGNALDTPLSSNSEGGIVNMNGGTLTVNSGATLRNSAANAYAGGGAIYMIDGTLTMYGTIQNCQTTGDGGAISAAAGTVTVGGTISGCTAVGGAKKDDVTSAGDGGAIKSSGASVIINADANLTGNRSGEYNTDALKSRGGAIYSDGAVTVNGGTLSNNTAEADGGAIYLSKDGSLVLTGGTISGNSAKNGAGIASQSSAGTNAISGGTIIGNTASGNGGALFLGNGTIAISGAAKIQGNKANSGNGGGVYFGGTSLTLSGGNIGAENKANSAQYGGGVYMAAGTLSMSSSSSVDYNSASVNGGGVYMAAGTLSMSDSASIASNSATNGDGGGVYMASGDLTVSGSASIASNTAANGDGGGVYMAAGMLTMSGSASIASNTATDGGGVYLYGTSTLTHSGENAEISGNTATGNGGAVYQNSDGASGKHGFTMEDGKLTGNTASLGGAVFVANDKAFAMSAGSITGNSANGNDGGAVNVEGANSRLYFSGSPVIYNNPSAQAGTQQKNVVLSVGDTAVINTTSTGLTGGTIGVYVIDGDVYNNHGIQDKPFGSYLDETSETKGNHADVFVNDRNLALYGVKKDDNLFYWVPIVCKLTDGDNNLLYRDRTINGKTVKVAAVYPKLEGTDADTGGFTAAMGTLYRYNSTTAYTGTEVQIKMLCDYVLPAGISDNSTVRNLTLTTAETTTEGHAYMANNDDSYIFAATFTADEGRLAESQDGEGNITVAADSIDTAIIRRDGAFTNASMIAVTGSKSLTAKKIILDGNKENAPVISDGGIFNVQTGTLVISTDAILRNSKAANGGAVYVASGAKAEMTGGSITSCSATNGGAIYNASAGTTTPAVAGFTMTGGEITGCEAASGGAVYVKANATMEMKDGSVTTGGTTTTTSGTINGNTATTAGAGIYLEEGSTLKLSGFPDFGGTGTESDDGSNVTAAISGPQPEAKPTNGNYNTNAALTPATGATNATNGQVTYSTARQDIFLAGYASNNATSIVVTGALTGVPGSIWVWAEESLHSKMLTQFALLDDGLLTTADGKQIIDTSKITQAQLDATYKVFRNAQDDVTTECGGDYLTGQEGDAKNLIKWTGGFDIVFRKIDSYGEAMNGATFTLYMTAKDSNNVDVFAVQGSDGKLRAANATDTVFAAYQQTNKTTNLKEDATGKSANIAREDAVTIKVNTGNASTPVAERAVYGDGLVRFEKIPPATYFLVETKVESGTKDVTDSYTPLTYKIVLDSKGYYTIYAPGRDADGNPVWTGTLTEATQKTFKEDADGSKKYTVTSRETDNTVDIYNIMNESAYSRKVIIKKGDLTRKEGKIDGVTPLEKAHFKIYRADMIEVTEGQSVNSISGLPVGYYESYASGVFFSGKLPYGKYYLLETKAPEAVGSKTYTENVGKVFVLTVNGDGTKVDTSPLTKVSAESGKTIPEVFVAKMIGE